MIEQVSEEILSKLSNCRYTGVQSNSKLIEKGNIFVAISGHTFDGHRYIDEAINRGSILIVGEKDIKNLPVPYIKVKNSRRALGLIAAHFFNTPANKHKMIAITGTNGKTTTAYLIKHILDTVGESCSLLGTVEYNINGNKVPSTHTTPDAVLLQKLLSESNDRYVVMEASSHGIEQHRLSGVELDYALFTNLSHDHLDYHGNLHNYFQAKARMFTLLKSTGQAIIGSYTDWGVNLIQQLKEEGKRILTIGEKDEDDLQLISVSSSSEKPIFLVKENNLKITLQAPLPGKHNIYNTMQAYLLAKRLGLTSEQIAKGLKSFPGVPGRFEQYHHQGKANFIVDYAHSPDAIAYSLQTARKIAKGKVVHIFGFRGKRDRKKRVPMLETSVELSDEVIITLDDLNGDSLKQMIATIQELIQKIGKGKCKMILDRTEAIKHAWDSSKQEDTVLITGKGPENYERAFTLPSQSDLETIALLKRTTELV